MPRKAYCSAISAFPRFRPLVYPFVCLYQAERMSCFRSLIRLLGRNERLAFIVSFGCLGGTNALLLLFHSVAGADARAVRPYMLIAFSDVKAREVRGKYGCATNKPHGGFVVYPLFMFCILNTYKVNPHGGFVVFPLFVLYVPNTHIVNRIAVSLFIGQG